MSVKIPAATVKSLAAKLDTLDLDDDEREALAVIFNVGLDAGRPRPEVQGFTPTGLVVSLPPPGTPSPALFTSAISNWSGGSGGDRPQESVTFNFTDVSFTTYPQ